MFWTEYDKVNKELSYRFMNDSAYIYYMYNNILRDELMSKITIYMKVNKLENNPRTKESLIDKF